MTAQRHDNRAGIREAMKCSGLADDALALLDADIDWVAAFREGRVREAYERLCRAEGMLPEMMSHIRADPAEEINLPLRQLWYMAAWTARECGLTGVHVPAESTGRRIAVVGGGPAGLAAAARLLESGHEVELFEREQQLGGAPGLVYCEERLPDPADEIQARFEPAVRTGRLKIYTGGEADARALIHSHDAVLMATGCWHEPSLGRAPGVWPALSFLRAVRSGRCTCVPSRVTVLCGGDAAMDAAVCARALGAKQLILLFSEPKERAHWHMPALWFEAAGTSVVYDIKGKGYRTDDTGAICCVDIEGGGVVETDMVIEAMGLYADPVASGSGLFAAGGMVNGGASVRQCMKDGEQAALDIHRFLGTAS